MLNGSSPTVLIQGSKFLYLQSLVITCRSFNRSQNLHWMRKFAAVPIKKQSTKNYCRDQCKLIHCKNFYMALILQQMNQKDRIPH